MATVDTTQSPWTTLQGVVVRPDDDNLTAFGMSSFTVSASWYWDLVLPNVDRLLQHHLGYVPCHSFFSGLIQQGGIHVVQKVNEPVSPCAYVYAELDFSNASQYYQFRVTNFLNHFNVSYHFRLFVLNFKFMHSHV